MLSYEDSNFVKQNQKLLCYHYTIGQYLMLLLRKRLQRYGFHPKFANICSNFYFAISK